MFTKEKWLKRMGYCPHYKQELQSITQKDVHAYFSFEHNLWNTQLGSRVYTIIRIYHLPQDTEQEFSNSNFIDQLTDLPTDKIPKHQDLIIMGDINILINNSEDLDAQALLNTIAAFNLKQHVNIPTHNQGHTLDLIITPTSYYGSLIAGSYVSDHSFITLETSHTKPKSKQEKRTVWKFNDEAIT